MTLEALNSSERQDWRTPGWFLDLVRQVGPIVLDPATGPSNPTGARAYYSDGEPDPRAPGLRLGRCGLRGTWAVASAGLVFVNPPYGAHMSGEIDPDAEITKKGVVVGRGRGWAAKIAAHEGQALTLVGTRHSTEWWDRIYAASHAVCLWRSPQYGSRIRFVDPDTGLPGPSPNLESSVFYRAADRDGLVRFAHTFSAHGRIFRGGLTL